MTFHNNTNYAFLNTLIRSMESKMLTAGEVERMIDAKNGVEAYKVLNDLDYADFLGENDKPEDFQKIINAGLSELKDLIQKNAPYPEIPTVIWSKFDFHNLKSLLKADIQKKEFDSILPTLSDLGEIEKSILKEQVKNPTSSILTNISANKQATIQKAIQQAKASYEETENPILIDAIIDQAYFSILKTQVAKFKIPFLKQYFQITVDLSNIQMYLRTLAIEKDRLFNDFFISGGTLTKNIFSGNVNDFENKIGLYANKLATGLKEYQDNKTFNQLEKDADQIILEHMLNARYMTFGPEPMFAFFWIKENNAQIIRMIMVNKLNNIEPVKIREKIKKLYS